MSVWGGAECRISKEFITLHTGIKFVIYVLLFYYYYYLLQGILGDMAYYWLIKQKTRRVSVDSLLTVYQMTQMLLLLMVRHAVLHSVPTGQTFYRFMAAARHV